jgi:hypothetical protein
MLHWPASAFCCAALLIAGGASAQPVPPSPDKSTSTRDEEIVVTGRRAVTPESFDEAVTKFVRDLGRPGPIGQISRWGEPVRPATQASLRASTIS